MGYKTFAQKAILEMVKKKNQSRRFQDFDETYTEYDENKYSESYGETYTVHDNGPGVF